MEVQDAQQPPAGGQQAGDQKAMISPARKLLSSSVRADLVAQIRGLAASCGAVPDICKRRAPGEPDLSLSTQVHDWEELRRRREYDLLQAYPATGLHPSTFVPTSHTAPAQQDPPSSTAAAAAAAAGAVPPPPLPMTMPMVPAAAAAPLLMAAAGGVPVMHASAAAAAAAAAAPLPADRAGVRQVGKVTKANKSRAGGRTFTSKFRGVHQTFPTRRWEAQFRRNGKPTSLGCFDHEEQAARAYDKMMLWCELHNAAGVKGGITNFDPSEYEADMAFLQQTTQDELVQMLRSDGRRQAAQRMMRAKREGSERFHDQGGSSEEED